RRTGGTLRTADPPGGAAGPPPAPPLPPPPPPAAVFHRRRGNPRAGLSAPGRSYPQVAENTARRSLRGRKVTGMQVIQSTKLANVCYDIRGPVLQEAMRLEAAGHRILKLNTGNPAAFGFECPPEILEDMLRSLGGAHGYGDSKGILPARRAVMQHYQTKGIDLDVED